jgi:hypothetical protein
MTIAGANAAKVAILKIEACFPDSVIGFIPDNSKADLHFVMYSFGLMKDQFLAVSRGATQDNLGLNKLLSFPLLAPDVREQRRIAGILSAYDELIENNKWRSALLEKMAEEIYREWFVRLRFPGHEKVKLVKGVPEGWRVAELKELASVNPSSISHRNTPETILYVDISSVSTNRIDEVTMYASKEAPGRARRRVRHGDIIWSSVRPANRAYCLIYDPPENLIVSTGFAVIRPNVRMPFTFLFFAVTRLGCNESPTPKGLRHQRPASGSQPRWGCISLPSVPRVAKATLGFGLQSLRDWTRNNPNGISSSRGYAAMRSPSGHNPGGVVFLFIGYPGLQEQPWALFYNPLGIEQMIVLILFYNPLEIAQTKIPTGFPLSAQGWNNPGCCFVVSSQPQRGCAITTT